ncbi:lipopolysaccharide core biosynthesis protein RfaZ [Kluyvera huaxiensis]|uniref:lipopolysaccharide core biosynthesis protein RfaZ n=1 Tax=Kluyvera sp. 142053 TaxID=3160979 RepID=UPI0032DEA93A
MAGIDVFSKWVCKTTYRLTHSEKYRHNKNFWPYFKVEREPSGTIHNVFFKKEKLNNIEIAHVEKTKPLLIMASGPSVNGIARQFFDDHFDYMGVNGASAMTAITFDWYAIIDKSFVIERIDLVREMVSREELVLFCPCKCLASICALVPWEEIRCKFKIIETVTNSTVHQFLGATYPVTADEAPFYWRNGVGFSDDINRVLFDYGTVTYPALQIACALGYKEIYLAGLDMNNFTTPRFYEQKENMLSTRLERDFNPVINAFITAQLYCEENNIHVVNLSPASAVNAFPKVAWDSVEK